MLHGVTTREQNRRQTVLNASARVLSRTSKFQSISTFLCDSLHWLPISQRVRFKVILVVWNSLLGRAPRYLQDLCLPVSSNQFRSCLRSSQQGMLLVPACHSSLMRRDEALPYRDHLSGIVFRQQFGSWLETASPWHSEASSKHSCLCSSWNNSRTVLDSVPENL